MRARVGSRSKHVRRALLPITQCALAAALAWWVATDLLGHVQPFFAPIAAVVSLNGARRVRRAIELVVGVAVGVGVGDLLIASIGSGGWQIALVVALAMGTAMWLDSAPLIATQAGSSAVLVATLLPPGGTGGFDRCLDALVGGGIGVLVIALTPADPVAPVRTAVNVLLAELGAILRQISAATVVGDLDAAEQVLERARSAQPLLDRLGDAIRGAQEITGLTPLRRSRRRQLLRYTTAADHLDYALRNTRILARRAHVALRDDEALSPSLPALLSTLADGVDDMRRNLAAGHDPAEARAALLVAARSISTAESQDQGFSGRVMLAQLRSATVDLLRASGMDRDHARCALQHEDPPPHRT